MLCNSCGNDIESYNRFCPKCGAPVQNQASVPTPGPPPYSPTSTPIMIPAAQPAKSSWGCGKILLIVGIVLALLGAGVGAAVYFGYRYAEKTLKSSEPYQLALTTLKHNAEVKEKLGEVTDTGFPLGSYSQDADGSGKAVFVMSVQGTKATGHAEVNLVRTNKVWRLESGFLRTANGDLIHLEDQSETGEDSVNANKDADGADADNVNARGAIKAGILNGKAITLPKPAYPPAARAAKASGTVTVQVLVDEEGNVVSAHAVSGHPLLWAAAVSAARQAKFAPREVSGKPAKVAGMLTYNFTLE